MHRLKFKPKKNNERSNTQKQNKNGGGEIDKYKENSFEQTQKHEKKCYYCGSGTNMLNNFNIRDTIERDQWFDRKVNVKINHQQEK